MPRATLDAAAAVIICHSATLDAAAGVICHSATLLAAAAVICHSATLDAAATVIYHSATFDASAAVICYSATLDAAATMIYHSATSKLRQIFGAAGFASGNGRGKQPRAMNTVSGNCCTIEHLEHCIRQLLHN